MCVGDSVEGGNGISIRNQRLTGVDCPFKGFDVFTLLSSQIIVEGTETQRRSSTLCCVGGYNNDQVPVLLVIVICNWNYYGT